MARLFPLWVGAALVLATPLTAQDFTSEELARLFERQREVFRLARESDLGQTRGLELVTVEEATVSGTEDLAASEAPNLAPLVPPGTTSGERVAVQPATGAMPGVPTSTTVQPVVFGNLDPSLQINLHIEFAFDSAVIEGSQIPKLEQMCSVMKSSDVNLFRVVGHTDAAGPEAYNEQLSVLRSREVARYLVNDCGLAPARLEILGMGERFLANPAEPRAEENRRVEFQAIS